MANITDSKATFLNGLSDLWTRFFKDKNQLAAMYRGAEILIGQAYLDMMSNVLNVSAREAPVFSKEFFKLLTIREDEIEYEAALDRYVIELPDNIKDFQFLYNKIYAPTVVLEKGVERTYDYAFEIDIAGDRDELRFYKSPFDWDDDGTNKTIPGVASRTIQVEDDDGNIVNTRQIAFWVPDAQIDRFNLYLTHGYLLNRFEPSSESYRALIRGISQYFILGPTVQHLVSALNVIVGLPVIRDDGEVLQSIDYTSSTDTNTVTTDRASYVFSKDVPLRKDVEDTDNWGVLEFSAFDHLTQAFTVKDSVVDPTWWYDITIPVRLLPDETRARRRLSPTLYENKINNPPGLVKIGDPGFIIGADEDGFVPDPAERTGRRHSFAYIVFERYLKHHVFAVIFDDALLTATTSVPFPRFDRDLQQIIVAGKSAYAYLYFEPAIEYTERVTLSDELDVNVVWTTQDDIVSINNNAVIGGRSWKIGDYYVLRYRKLTFVSSGYAAALNTDVGKYVGGATTSHAGVLLSFDNTAREWVIVPDDWSTDTFDQAEAVSVVGGVGGGTTAGASEIGTEPYVGNVSDHGGSIHPMKGYGETPVIIGGCDPTAGLARPLESGSYARHGIETITTYANPWPIAGYANVFRDDDVGLWVKMHNTGEYHEILEVLTPYQVRVATTGFGFSRYAWSLWRAEGESEGATWSDSAQVRILDASGNPIPLPLDLWIGATSIYHWDRSVVTQQVGTAEDIYGIWGKHVDDMWAVGTDGTLAPYIFHWNGFDWKPVTSPASATGGHLAIWGPTSDDFWVVGASGEFYHWDGTLWSSNAGPGGAGAFSGLWGTATDNIYAVAATFYMNTPGLIYHWNGTAWTEWTPGSPNGSEVYTGIWGTAPNDFWVVGLASGVGGIVWHWNGSTFNMTLKGDGSIGGLTFGFLYRIWGTDSDNIWAVGPSGVILYGNGSYWVKQTCPIPGLDIYGIWGLRPDDVFAVGYDSGDTYIIHWDGSTWSTVETISGLPAQYSAGGVWA